MANRKIILLHVLESDIYEFYGSPASLFDKHEAKELLIAQTSLNNHFSKQAAQGKGWYIAIPIVKFGKVASM